MWLPTQQNEIAPRPPHPPRRRRKPQVRESIIFYAACLENGVPDAVIRTRVLNQSLDGVSQRNPRTINEQKSESSAFFFSKIRAAGRPAGKQKQDCDDSRRASERERGCNKKDPVRMVTSGGACGSFFLRRSSILGGACCGTSRSDNLLPFESVPLWIGRGEP